MSVVLHGTWSAGVFFVWGESSAAAPRRGGRPARIPAHPFAASPADLRAAMAEVMVPGDWEASPTAGRVALLPTAAGGPARPPWLDGTAATEDAGEETAAGHLDDGQIDPQDRATGSPSGGSPELWLAPWRVTGLALDVLAALDLLVSLPAVPGGRREWGADLQYWGLVAKLGLEILAQQRYVPGLVRDVGDAGSVRAAWLVTADDPHDLARLRLLAEAMPPACRAVLKPGRPDDPPPAPRVLLDEFLGCLIDRAVRDWGGPARDKRRPVGGDVAGAWWAALWDTEDARIRVPAGARRDLARLFDAWQAWLAAGRPASVDAPFRLCFRLEPPEVDPETGQVTAPDWTLRYLLQANDDPSLLVPAGQVWQARGGTLRAVHRRFEQAQERVLAGLGLAARLFSPIMNSLRAATPEAAPLSVDEAYAFLREVGPLLESSGFGVLVPPWWNKPGARLAVRGRVAAPEGGVGAGTLRVTLDSLVEFRWELALGDEVLTREEFERLAALKIPLVQVRGRWVLLQPDQVEAAIAFWEKKRRQGTMPLRDALAVALGAAQDVDGLPVEQVETDGRMRELIAQLRAGDRLEPLPQPEGFNGLLRPYQLRGYSWLDFLRRWGLGACLADDMGLGKTAEAIALLVHERGQNGGAGDGRGPALVICPTSVVGNWQREIERFGPGLRVMIHHGGERASGEALVAAAADHDVVISTYGLLRRDVDDLARVPWSHVILDEAQNVKNPHAKQSQAARRLGEQTPTRIAMTGTPVENRLAELWSIMQFLNPGLLGSEAKFRKAFALPIERYQDAGAMDRLKKLAGPFILRRVKTDPAVISDLPDKLEMKVYCSLTPEQATLYEAVVQDSLRRVIEAETEGQAIDRRGAVLSALLKLKQVCNHPAHFLGDGSPLPGRSGKLDRLAEMLEEALAEGDRALIFTQFAEMGHLLRTYLAHVLGVEVLYLHGGTPPKQRDRMVERFQQPGDGAPVFILSLRAGGTGLNLTAANHVFHFDRWWNPAVENQATDRAFRIGQTRNVQVHKLICAGTLEERIDDMIEAKKALAASVIGAGEDWLTELSTDDLRNLLVLRQD